MVFQARIMADPNARSKGMGQNPSTILLTFKIPSGNLR